MALWILLVSCFLCAYAGKVVDLGDIADKLEVKDYEISGEDLINSFTSQNKTLIVKGACKSWPIYKALREQKVFDEKLKDIKVFTSMVHHETYGGEESTIGEYVTSSLAGSRFERELSEIGLTNMVYLPFMISSCKKLEKDFVNGHHSLYGAKTKIPSDVSSGCATDDTLLAILSGKGKISYYGKKSSFQTHSGDLIYVPKHQCFRFHSKGVFMMVRTNFKNSVNNSSECARRSVYDVTKDMQMAEQDEELALHDHYLPDKELNSGYKMPPIGFGTARLKTKTYDTVSKALEVGYRMIDTAQVYTGEEEYENFKISSEEEIGRAIRDSGIEREELFLVTKLDADFKSFDDAMAKLNMSLQRLGTDYLDLVLVHTFFESKCKPEQTSGKCAKSHWQAWRALEKFKTQGFARSIGVSNVFLSDLQKLLDISQQKVSVVQNWFDPLHQDQEVRKICKENGIAYMGYGNLGNLWTDEFQQKKNPVLTEPTLIDVGVDNDLPVASVVLRWAMQRDVIVIPTSLNFEHIAMNFNTRSQFVLEDLAKKIDSLDNKLGDPDKKGWKPPKQTSGNGKRDEL